MLVVMMIGCGGGAGGGPVDAGAGDAPRAGDAGGDAGSHAPAACAKLGYPSPPVIDTATGAAGMVMADLDGDGRPDLIVGQSITHAVRVFLTVGDGTFRQLPDVAVPLGNRPIAFDANRDGKLDVALVGRDDVVVLLGNGDGTLQPARSFATGPQPINVGAGDFNHDGVPDLVTGNAGESTLSVLLGNGDGTFQAHRDLPAGLQLGPLVVGDLDGDGVSDVVVADQSSDRVLIFLGDGKGGLVPGTDVRTGARPFAVALADLDGDGALDVVVGNENDHDVVVLLGDGHGQLTARAPVALGVTPFALAIADVDHDGHRDVLVASFAARVTLRVLAGTGGGGLVARSELSAGGTFFDLAVSDVDGDGALDVIATDLTGEGPAVLRGRGDGRFATGVDFPVGTQNAAMASGDLDRDGVLDLAIATADPALDRGSVHIARGTPAGGFAAPSDVSIGGAASAIALADLDHDGALDLIVGRALRRDVVVARGDGHGGFGATVAFDADATPSAIAVGDFDRDGALDVAVARGDGADVHVLRGDGAGGLGAPVAVAVGGAQAAVVAADLDRDGALDLVVQRAASRALGVLRGRGDGTFAAAVDYPTSASAAATTRTIALVDADHDGVLDVVALDTIATGNTIAVLRGRGDATLRAPVESPAAVDTTPSLGSEHAPVLALADLDLDGELDAVVTSEPGNVVAIFHGRGDARFAGRADYKTASLPSAPVIADVDHDGLPDVIVLTSALGAAEVLHASCLAR